MANGGGPDDGSERKPPAENGYIGYRCYFIVEGHIRRRIELQASDDSEAIRQSRAQLDQSPYQMAEVWCLNRKIDVIGRSGD
ncbi:MAG TPA: hypothetical protein VHB27_18240 [Rhodopila sp.]|uniref:hypothetical protein n=1 Tax=Rhodopila sp. TaxID=2480087 RepID=UPI002C6070A4|nr:hypothetical protein [Rhodopila sp.]HVY17169.1 hypothetical protein [Rhodopila sp.]